MTVDVQFAVEEESAPSASEIARWVGGALNVVRGCGEAAVSVRVVGSEEMRALNGEYRGQDKTTNVLSFPAGTIDGFPDDEQLPLGDIVVCAPVICDEAQSQGKTLGDHWAHMMVHGALHLLGFDHVENSEALEMESLEIRILMDYGVANPYGESPRET